MATKVKSGGSDVSKAKHPPTPQKEQTPTNMETCAGCGAQAEEFPIIGVVNKDDELAHLAVIHSLDNPDWKGIPVCDACWRNPAHRKTPLKCHFFLRGAGKIGVAAAGSDTIRT